ncbi:hypothetical protein U5801_19895, partial [Lamprobacter modestohalophilus]|uniref:hypothetical protein n=1 Tax=Lamprobacter modestohalophilus TaxID=1064514 RepID=UPI002ADEF0A3
MALVKKLRIILFSLVAALVTSGVTHAATPIAELPDPYRYYRTALISNDWQVVDYVRARQFYQFKSSSLNDLSQDTLLTIDEVEKWNKRLKVLLDITDLFLMGADVLLEKGFIVLRLKDLFGDGSSFFAKYINQMAAETMSSPDVVIDSIVYSAWLLKLADTNGVGDTGFGDLYDLLISDDVQFDESLRSYLLGDWGLGATFLTKWILDGLSLHGHLKAGATPKAF